MKTRREFMGGAAALAGTLAASGAAEAEPIGNVYLGGQGGGFDFEVAHAKKSPAVQDAAELHDHQLDRRRIGKERRWAIAGLEGDGLGVGR